MKQKRMMYCYYMLAHTIQQAWILPLSSGKKLPISARKKHYFPSLIQHSKISLAILSQIPSLHGLVLMVIHSQGFASSSLENDAFPIRHFFARNLELCVAQSFSKNMGLYGERVGAFHLVTSSETAKDQSFRRLVRIQRGEISSPPAFGAKIATKILSEPTLFRQWEQDLAKMNTRLQGIRYELWKQLTLLGTPGNWDHLRTQVCD